MTAFLSRLFRRPREDAPVWIEVGELQRRLAAGDAVVVVDVRQPEEFTAPPGHLPGAVNVPLADLSGRAGELAARREPVVLVCKTDRRSARAATELLAAGLRDVVGGQHEQHLIPTRPLAAHPQPRRPELIQLQLAPQHQRQPARAPLPWPA
jgi:rhodanese-related sulfurtransferase